MVQSWEDCALTTLLCSLILILNSILNLVSCRKQKKYRGDRKDNLEIIYELPRNANSQNKPKSHPDGKGIDLWYLQHVCMLSHFSCV